MTAATVPNLRPSAVPAPPTRRPITRLELRVLAGLLLATAVLYLWNLGSVGWANLYYSGAVHAMSKNWKAFLFGSIDAGNTVTVDKPPGALWYMALSARMFGLNPWSMLVPQALMGVGAVALLYAAARRAAGPGAGFAAAATLALTPVAVAMFRYNNPDALLVLLLVMAGYATVRAAQTASTGWLLIAGTLLGFAFLTKMGQALIPLPAFALAYLIAAPTGFGRRIRQLFAAGSRWSSRAAGGSRSSSCGPPRPPVHRRVPHRQRPRARAGLQRARGIFGLEDGPAGGGVMIINGVPEQTGPGFGSDPGPLRMIDAQNGVLAGWLLPTALALLLVGLWLTRRAPRTDVTRASLLVWGGWTVVTALVFSLARGIYHSYYTVELAPGVAAVVGIGGALLWDKRRTWMGRACSPCSSPAQRRVRGSCSPGRRSSSVAAVGCRRRGGGRGHRAAGPAGARRLGAAVMALAVALTTLTGSTAYAVQTVADGDRGGMPGMGPAAGPARTPRSGAGNMLRSTGRTWSAATVGAQNSAALALASDTTVMGIGGFSGATRRPRSRSSRPSSPRTRCAFSLTAGPDPAWAAARPRHRSWPGCRTPSARRRRRPHGLRLHRPHRHHLREPDRLARLGAVIGRALETARSGAEQAVGSARAVVALTRSGVVRPIRPDRLLGMAAGLARYGLTITAGYAAGAARHPDRTAVVDDAGTLTFAELASWTDALARGFAESGVGPGARLGVLCRNHRGAIAGQVAAGKLGADAVLLNTGLSAAQLREVAGELALHTVVADEEFGPALAGLPEHVRVVTDTELGDLDGPGPLPRRPPAGHTIVLTSGTTGTPKGARRPPLHSISPAAAILSAIPLRSGEPAFIAAPLLHTWGFAALQLAVLHGAPVVLARKFSPAGFLRIAEEQRADAVFAVPVMLQRVLELPDAELATAGRRTARGSSR